MASTFNEKSGALAPGGPQLTVATTEISPPERAALTTAGPPSLTLTPVDHEKSIDLGRESTLSTPRSSPGSNPFDTDIEAMITTNSESFGLKPTHTVTKSDCQVWPGKEQWKQKKRAAKMNRKCNCMSRLSKRNQIICKIAIGLFIIGTAVGVGVGISKPLGAPIWGNKSNDDQN